MEGLGVDSLILYFSCLVLPFEIFRQFWIFRNYTIETASTHLKKVRKYYLINL